MIAFLLLLYLPLAWFLARALRHPRDAALWMVVACLTLRTVDGPGVMPTVRELVAPAMARWFFDVALTGSWTALLLFFVISARGSAKRIRTDIAIWVALGGILGVCIVLTPGWRAAPNLLAQPGHPLTVSLYSTLTDLYYVYATGSCSLLAWRYATESPRRTRPGLWLASIGLGVFALASATALLIDVGAVPNSLYNDVLYKVMGYAIVAFATGVCLVGLVGRAVALRVWWSHYRRHRALRPLWSLLHAAYPSDALDGARRKWWLNRTLPSRVHRRYWRRWIEIRDGLVQLSPHLADAGYDPTRPAHLQAETFHTALSRVAAGKVPSTRHAVPVAIPTEADSEDADVTELIQLSTTLPPRHENA